MSSFLVPVYAAYALIAVPLVVWLARTLFKNGAVFLDTVFDDRRIAEAVNRLLVVGFYLFNLGWTLLWMKADGAQSEIAAVETLAWKLGALLVALGAMHFANMYLFYRIRRRAQLKVLPPPVAPQMRIEPQPVATYAPHVG